jgi:hypothetical protein
VTEGQRQGRSTITRPRHLHHHQRHSNNHSGELMIIGKIEYNRFISFQSTFKCKLNTLFSISYKICDTIWAVKIRKIKNHFQSKWHEMSRKYTIMICK